MNVTINGKPATLDGEQSLSELLDSLGYQNQFVAVAVNRACVKRSAYGETVIQERDEIEILAPMAGG
jgi:sulfur carrier protein